MMQQIIRTASSELMYCLCKYVICRIQQFPCNKLLKKQYVIPRYNNYITCAPTQGSIWYELFLWHFARPSACQRYNTSASPISMLFKADWWKDLRAWSYVWYNVLVLQQLLPTTSGESVQVHQMMIEIWIVEAFLGLIGNGGSSK